VLRVLQKYSTATLRVLKASPVEYYAIPSCLKRRLRGPQRVLKKRPRARCRRGADATLAERSHGIFEGVLGDTEGVLRVQEGTRGCRGCTEGVLGGTRGY
jgi:hypothetical protein